jgi:hypothetical protein
MPALRTDALVSGSGTWRLDTSDPKRRRLQLVFRSIHGGGHEAEVPFGAQLQVWKRGTSLALSYFRGDPDERDRVEFEKVRR